MPEDENKKNDKAQDENKAASTIQKIVREHVKESRHKSEIDSPQARGYLEQLKGESAGQSSDVGAASRNLVHEVSKIGDDEKKVSVLKRIVQETKSNPDAHEIILKQSVDALKHLPYKDKLNFINFCVHEDGKQELYSQEHTDNSKQRQRNLDLYEKFLDFDAEDIEPGKNILLVGGGDSKIQADLPQQNVTNYDMKKDDGDKSVAKEHVEGNFTKELDASVKGKQDEIWCMFSLPMYSESTTQIKDFFTNAVGSAKDGANIRIFPVEHYGESTSKNASYALISDELKEFEGAALSVIEENKELFEVKRHEQKVDKSFSKKKGQGITITVKDAEKAEGFLKESLGQLEERFLEEHREPKQPKTTPPAEITFTPFR